MEALPDFEGLLDWAKLGPWIEEAGLPGDGPVTQVEQLTGGSQNALFLLNRGGERMVLRRPPEHPRNNSNQTMLREARVLRALAGSAVPHPRLLAVCDQEDVIGACYYLMEPLEGFSPKGPLPGGYAERPVWRRKMGEELIRAGAALAAIDHQAAGLGDFGKPDHWHSRQVDRWRSQLESYRTYEGYFGDDAADVDFIGRWLSDNLPDERRIGVIHGDLQWPNVMFRHDRPEISGLIDWELSTLGDPMLDLGWVLSSWREDGDPEGPGPIITPWRGFMTRADLVALYGQLTGRDMAAAPWFFALACYKLGCILEGSYARSLAGQASTEIGNRLHLYARWLFAKARQLIARA